MFIWYSVDNRYVIGYNFGTLLLNQVKWIYMSEQGPRGLTRRDFLKIMGTVAGTYGASKIMEGFGFNGEVVAHAAVPELRKTMELNNPELAQSPDQRFLTLKKIGLDANEAASVKAAMNGQEVDRSLACNALKTEKSEAGYKVNLTPTVGSELDKELKKYLGFANNTDKEIGFKKDQNPLWNLREVHNYKDSGDPEKLAFILQATRDTKLGAQSVNKGQWVMLDEEGGYHVINRGFGNTSLQVINADDQFIQGLTSEVNQAGWERLGLKFTYPEKNDWVTGEVATFNNPDGSEVNIVIQAVSLDAAYKFSDIVVNPADPNKKLTLTSTPDAKGKVVVSGSSATVLKPGEVDPNIQDATATPVKADPAQGSVITVVDGNTYVRAKITTKKGDVAGWLGLDSNTVTHEVISGPQVRSENMAKKLSLRMSAGEFRSIEPDEEKDAKGLVFAYGPYDKQGKWVSYLLDLDLEALGPNELYEFLNAGEIEPRGDTKIRWVPIDKILDYMDQDGQTYKPKKGKEDEVGRVAYRVTSPKGVKYSGKYGDTSYIRTMPVRDGNEAKVTTFVHPDFIDSFKGYTKAWLLGEITDNNYLLSGGTPDLDSQRAKTNKMSAEKIKAFFGTLVVKWKGQQGQ
jgi:hypothetical protein